MSSEELGPAAEPERMSLDLVEPGMAKRRAWAGLVVAVLLGGALGGLFGLIFGRDTGLIVALVVAGLILLLSWGTARRSVWLQGTVVSARAFGMKAVDLRTVEQLELIVTDMRGARTVGMLVSGPPKGRAVNVSLATYAGTGGRELGILVLRRLADVLAASENTAGLVFSQLLVAQLRAEARGEAPPDRPLYQLASLAPAGRLAQRLRIDAVTKFVSALD
ncbi:hypothetical protein EV193_109121 [Herbihabitans rhizosphaerae]|uniref:Uncharacterized protein n=1 Tax=Herbihabitans rhizosphaerae TaxID=1872711 RepID=A0A4Q7KIC3_9PSEU|nr:hypothetical protein [Herbihabitans rhizosphaerae]RZS34334.1 hypothetical protein EV193_109121 [Herbihabitans rhizosphaerae]